MASARLLILLCIVVCLSQLLRSDAVRLESGAPLDKAAPPFNSSFCDSSCKDSKFTSVLGCIYCLAKHNISRKAAGLTDAKGTNRSNFCDACNDEDPRSRSFNCIYCFPKHNGSRKAHLTDEKGTNASNRCDACKDPKSKSYDPFLCMMCDLPKHNASKKAVLEPLESADAAKNSYSAETCNQECQPGSTAYFSEACSTCRSQRPTSGVEYLPKDASPFCRLFCSSSSSKNAYICKMCPMAPAPAPAAPPTMSKDPPKH